MSGVAHERRTQKPQNTQSLVCSAFSACSAWAVLFSSQVPLRGATGSIGLQIGGGS